MSKHLQNLMATRERILEMPESDQAILLPLIDGNIAKFEFDPVRFAQVGHKFVVDTTEVRNLLGFGYLQEVLRRKGGYVTCTELSPIRSTVEFVPVAEPSMIRSTINRQKALEKKLRWLQKQIEQDHYDDYHGDSFYREEQLEIAEQLLELKRKEKEDRAYLNRNTYGGRIKHIRNDYDRCRESTVKCMRRAIDYLVANEDTKYIGQHLNEHVKPRARTRYSGNWQWIFE